MIKVRNLQKNFDGQWVLKGIDLDIHDQETIVILGPSGQGKTVLIKTMVRLLKPDCGTIEYDDLNILKLPQKEMREFQKKIAFVFQNSALFDFLNVNENLSLYLKMNTRLSKAAIAEEIDEALHFVGLDTDIRDKFPEELSGGMKKRVAIARAMIQKPGYFFYDEPTTALDKGNAEKISELIVQLKTRLKMTSIIVTHDIKLMREVSDRVALLKEGKIIFIGSKEEISGESLESLYQTGMNHGL